jgi:outer membrane protein TolC
MRLLTTTLLLLGLTACRTTAPLTPLPVGVDAHVRDATGLTATEAAPDGQLGELEARTRAIMNEWDERLTRPESLVHVLDFASPRDTSLQEAAVAASFPGTLEKGLAERQLVVSAFARSPVVRSAFLKLRASLNQYAQVTYLDTILSQYASFQRTSRKRVGMPLAGDRIDQNFPFPGSIELKAALVKHSVEEARAKYAATVRNVVVGARVLFARYVFVGSALRISEAMLQYLVQLEDAARGKLEAGSGSKGTVIQVQVEISNLRNKLVTLQQDQHMLQADMARLLDIDLDTKIGPPEPRPLPSVDTDSAGLRAAALENQPDIQIADARVRRMQTMIELAEQSAYPALSPGLSTMEGISHATGGSDKDREPFSTRPKIKPDPWFGTKEAYLREARESARAAVSRAEAARNETAFSVESALAQYETAKRLHTLYRDVQLAQAEQAYRDAASGYAASRVEFLNVVDSLRRWLGFQLEADRAERDMHMSHARLEGALGRPIKGEQK